jgi:alanine racemase
MIQGMKRPMPHEALSWIEVSRDALVHNVGLFRTLAGARKLMVVVKANAYGHGMVPVARTALEAGADHLAVFAPTEAFALREAGVEAPVLILGPTPRGQLARAAELGIRVTIASPAAVDDVLAARPTGLRIHLKVETGTNRQGFPAADLDDAGRLLGVRRIAVEGAYSHYADIEDTTDHGYAMEQLRRFGERVEQLRALGLGPELLHASCSAATLLFEETYWDLVRVGISAYGLWPSKETLVSVRHAGREPLQLRPAMTWKTRIAQVKAVPAGETVGYGRTHKTTRDTRLAILPVGYANGYDRSCSDQAHVLVRGRRARVCGRVMMNMIAVDVTDVPGAAAGDEVVLLGAQGDERISAEELAAWSGTINYEVVARAEPVGPRLLV